MLAKVGQNEEKVRFFFISGRASEKNLTFGRNFWSRLTVHCNYHTMAIDVFVAMCMKQLPSRLTFVSINNEFVVSRLQTPHLSAMNQL